MNDKAMDRIRDEMAKKADHPGVSILGEYFTDRLQKDSGIGEKLMAEGKTLTGAFDEIRRYAEKNRGGNNWAFVPPEKGFAIACGYFGIEYGEAEEKKKEKKIETDDLDLDALLGGI